MPPAPRRGIVPEPVSVVALALLIVEKAEADTVDGDLEVICRLLRQKCAWSDESLLMLRRTVATALDGPEEAPPPVGATD